MVSTGELRIELLAMVRGLDPSVLSGEAAAGSWAGAPRAGPAETPASAADSPAEHGASARRAPTPPPKLPGGNNIKIIVRIDHTALARGHTVAGETCEVAGLGPISVATAQALMADAFLAAVITKGRDVINVAHLGRGLNAHQRTALEAAGLRCSNRACNKTIALQIDHRVPYADHPETRLDNQDPLCPDCHRRKTHHGWHLEPGHGPRRLLPPDPVPERAGRHRDSETDGRARAPAEPALF